MPAPGTVVADLATLKLYVGARGAQDDALLETVLVVATEHAYWRVAEASRLANGVQQAILLVASRLYKRRQSPEGVAGFGGEGAAVTILFRDPDVDGLLAPHLDYSQHGIA